MRRILAALLSLAAASLILAGCGDDDGGSATPPADEAPADASSASNDEEPDEADETDPDPGSVDPMDISSLSDGECLTVGNALTTVLSRGIIGDFDSDLATIRSFAAGAPAETHGDFETFLDAYEASYQMLDDAGIDLGDASTVEAGQDTVNAATELIETPEVETALAAAEEVFFEACPVMRPQ